MPKPVRPFLGESAASRVQHRRDLFVQTAFEALANGTWRSTSIAQLCRDVNLNKRYFYESFQSLENLEDAVVSKFTTELIAVGLKASADASARQLNTEDLARHVLAACVSWLTEDTRRARVLFSKAADNPQARSHRENVIEQLSQTLSTFGFDYHRPQESKFKVTETHRTVAKLSSALLIGGTIESILSWLDGRLDLEMDEFVDYIAQFWVALANTAIDIAAGKKSNRRTN